GLLGSIGNAIGAFIANKLKPK
uniref:Dahlein-5.2 n=2 Tax=Ranoidea dahlii TaxID=299727 RepID=DAH52_RANDH|nr:RecName: Full=Dahlein-5.2 [Ranoidea dahlii]